MTTGNQFWQIVGIVVFISLLVPYPVLAYLDPGTGSYIVQLLIGAVVGLGFLVKVNWNRFKALFSRRDSEASGDQE